MDLILRTAWVMGLSLMVCGQSMAADSMALPAGEDLSLWRAPLALADLEWSEDQPRVQIDVEDGTWRLHLNGSSRSATVPIPQTRAQREEVAFLARGLVRATDQLDAVAPNLATPLPPPPKTIPRPSKAAKAVVAVKSEVLDTAEREGVSVAEPQGAIVSEPDINGVAVLEAAVASSVPTPEVVAAASPKRTSAAPIADGSLDDERLAASAEELQSPRLYAPAMRLSFDVSGRLDAGEAFTGGFGFDVAKTGRLSFGVDLSRQSRRSLNLGLARGVQSIDAHLSAPYTFNRSWALGPTIGAAYRMYRQQGETIEEGTVLVLGVENQLVLVRNGQFAVSWDQYLRVDQGVVNIIQPDGRVSSANDFEMGAGISVRYGGTRDPF